MARSVGRRVAFAVAVSAVSALAASGCGAERAAMRGAAEAALDASSARLSSAAIRLSDVPEGFMPAEDQEVFRGMRPSGPECARLLRMVDEASAKSSLARRDVPQTHAAFYRADPAVSVVEHVLRLRPGEAARRVEEARQATAGCPSLDFALPGDTGWDGRKFDKRGLSRTPLDHPDTLADAVAARYSHPDGGRRYGLDVMFARAKDDLVVFAAPGEFDGDGEKQIRSVLARVMSRAAAAPEREVVLTPTPQP
ncbi:hypothetical protein [Actinomadura gamaensis]|uniref:Lipoprotein n=1 Tax=Actinomadura gamaensis TaxID=1763541 RepID=A0ABV9TT00_9ACTN